MDAEFFFNDIILPQKPCPFNCKNHRLTGVFCANSFALIDLCHYFVCQFLQQPQTPPPLSLYQTTVLHDSSFGF